MQRSLKFIATPRSILIAAALAGLGGIAGCKSTGGPTADTSGSTNSSAITTPGVTHESDSDSQFTTMRAFPTGDKSSSVLMVEAMGPKSVRVQHEASYQMKVTNLTDMPVKNVSISSTTPDGFDVSATAKPGDNGMMSYPVGDLGPKESKTITITGKATKVGSIDTCYSVHYNPPTLCTNVEVTNPAITLAVNAPADTDICKQVTYTYTVTNTGTGVAHNVMLNEDLPEGLMTADGKSSVSANVGDIPQGQNRVVTAILKASKTGSFPGKATAKSDDEAAQPVSTVTAVHAPMLDVAVTGSANDYVGKQVAYKIVVTNKGDAPANNAKLQVSRSNTLGSVMVEGIDSSGNLALGDLAPNASKTVNATVTSDQGGTVTVAANASADCASPVSGSAATMFNTIPAILLETVDETDPVKVGENVVYDIKVTNQGSGPDTNIMIKAVVPDGEQYVSTDGATQPTVDGMNLTFPAIPSLAPKASVTWKVTVKAVKAGDVSFKTSATSDGVKSPAEKTEPTKLY